MAPPQWAYQVENFVTEPDEELVCSICRAVFCDPVMCPCDHVFCRACITKWIQSNRNCPICRKRVSYNSLKQTVSIVKNIIMKLMLNCHNKSLGCAANFSVESSETHVKECEYELVQCKNKPCKDRLFRKDITEHETSDCPHRYIKCKSCGLKMPTSVLPKKHDCVRALQLRLRRKNNMIRKKNERIKQLRNEIKALKSASQVSEQSLSDASRNFSHLSPEEIMLNIAEFDSSSFTSSSLSSDSENFSDDSIIIFTNSSPIHSRNTESDSFFNFMDDEDSIEYPRNERESSNPHSMRRNAESQTTDELALNDSSNGLISNRNIDLACEEGPSSEAALCNFGENENRSQSRSVKRRPTTQKPAKRRFPNSTNFSDVGESVGNFHSLSNMIDSLMEVNTENAISSSNANNISDVANTQRVAVAGTSFGTTWDVNNVKFTLFPPQKQKHTRSTNNAVGNTEDARNATSSSNATFERTRALLEQYSLESDSDWLPEYASHRGDTSDSDVSESYNGESSNSELSEEENLNGNRNADISDLLLCSFDNTSDEDDDPDWNPMICMNTRSKFAPKRI